MTSASTLKKWKKNIKAEKIRQKPEIMKQITGKQKKLLMKQKSGRLRRSILDTYVVYLPAKE